MRLPEPCKFFYDFVNAWWAVAPTRDKHQGPANNKTADQYGTTTRSRQTSPTPEAADIRPAPASAEIRPLFGR
jgi:hypothetical protein